MNTKKYTMKFKILFFALLLLMVTVETKAQDIERERPAEWENLISGGRFMDRFLTIPVRGDLKSDVWGASQVIPRYVDNGIEDNEWSYWGGDIKKGNDGTYHLYVCRWAENSPKGHMQWRDSEVVHAVSKNSIGPFQVKSVIGPGHNPESFVLEDGRKVIYVINSYYISDNFDGAWKKQKFDFDNRDRKIIEGLTNLTFAKREDGSFLMVCRGGGVWFSKDGISPYLQVSNERVYPPVEGRFEDPVVWKTNIQYHMIVNDWYGRIAWYLRSKDGINWKVDPGEAYMPGMVKYEDGTIEDWYKYERIKMLQDEYGRAIQANFAVIDTIKWNDLKSDNHSSKNISIPLTYGRLATLKNKNKITSDTKEIYLKIEAEAGFNPHTDIDLKSLRFGASEEVNFGKGCKVASTEKSGDNLIITFEGKDNGLTADNYTAKLLGKTSEGKLLFAYARLPWLNYNEPILSARLPIFTEIEGATTINLEVQNFGQIKSGESNVEIFLNTDKKYISIASQKIDSMVPFEKAVLTMRYSKTFEKGKSYKFKIIVDDGDLKHEVFEHEIIPFE